MTATAVLPPTWQPDEDPARIAGAMKDVRRRELPDGALIEFEQAPAGWLAKNGNIRRADWRAYYGTLPNAEKRKRQPSVTGLLDDICGKGGLPAWYETRGIEGAITAVRMGLIDPRDPESAARAVDIVRSNQLGADRARDEAATRGLDIHACLEHYMRSGSPPSRASIRPEWHGYFQALCRWLLAAEPEPVAVEELVWHPEDGYAGRLDLRADMRGALTTIDCKTQERAGIYLQAHAQVNLYERAARRCGDPPADRLLVVVFAANGEYREMPADHPEAFTDAALAWVREGRPVNSMCESHNRTEREARKAAA
jgi:hypothetical protein